MECLPQLHLSRSHWIRNFWVCPQRCPLVGHHHYVYIYLTGKESDDHTFGSSKAVANSMLWKNIKRWCRQGPHERYWCFQHFTQDCPNQTGNRPSNPFCSCKSWVNSATMLGRSFNYFFISGIQGPTLFLKDQRRNTDIGGCIDCRFSAKKHGAAATQVLYLVSVDICLRELCQ